MRFKKFLTEGVSSILYHHTTVNKIHSILKDDKIRLANMIGTSSDQLYKGKKFKPYFLSTSRIKYGGYARSFGTHEQVNVVLDGKQLSYTMAGNSVDYWGPGFRTDDTSPDMRLRNQENEDRLFSEKPTIDNVAKFIKEIHILMDSNYIMMQDDYTEFKNLSDTEQHLVFKKSNLYRDISSYSTVYGIEVYFYKDFESFKLLNKTKSNKNMETRETFVYYVELFDKNDKESLSKEADRLRYDIVYSYDGSEARVLSNQLHNKRGDGIASLSISKLISKMHKYKLRTPEDVIKYLKEKWKTI